MRQKRISRRTFLFIEGGVIVKRIEGARVKVKRKKDCARYLPNQGLVAAVPELGETILPLAANHDGLGLRG
jgi:hypothetical protein